MMSGGVQVRVGTIDFEVTGVSETVDQTLRDVADGQSAHLHFANAWSIALAQDDPLLQASFGSGRSYPDGVPVVWAMRALARKEPVAGRPQRVNGPAFFESLMDRGRRAGLRHYFLGSTDQTLAKLIRNVEAKYPGMVIAGTSSPPFRELNDADLAKEVSLIIDSAPHVVWVGLGTPKQDLIAARLASLHPAVYACVGAAFDLVAGNFRPAPAWIQPLGLEWLYRLVQEPRRLWHRYSYGNAKFVSIVATQLLRRALRAGDRARHGG